MNKIEGGRYVVSLKPEKAGAYYDLMNIMARVLTRGSYVWICQQVGMLPRTLRE